LLPLLLLFTTRSADRPTVWRAKKEVLLPPPTSTSQHTVGVCITANVWHTHTGREGGLPKLFLNEKFEIEKERNDV
jgi:hypothetical protein